ncbi:MAG: Ig-like domain-containing protein [Gemmatimonadaceae bacterium]
MAVRMRARVQLVPALVALATACAAPAMPPGGPPDSAAPAIRRVTPDSNATRVTAKAIVIHFDEVISERPRSVPGAPAGAGLEALIQLSPTDGRERVTWRRTAIAVEPRRGFRPNTAYRVTLLPGVTDLRGNVLDTPSEFVFSTGAEIPTGAIEGVVFDWAAGRAASRARVEVFAETDTALRWVASADTTGRFVVRDLAPGSFVVRAWLDANGNRLLDPREAFDRATLAITDRGAVELYAFVHDTLSPRLDQVVPRDSTALRVRFDRAVAADWVAAGAVSLVGADSLPIATGTMLPAAQADTVRAVTTQADTTQADTTLVPPPVFGRALPVQQWVVPLDTALAPGLYRLRILGVRGLNGVVRDTEREFRVREPPPPKPDSAAARPPPTDSVPPPSGRPR